MLGFVDDYYMKKRAGLRVSLICMLILSSCIPPQINYRNIHDKRNQIISTAIQYLGVPYRNGGVTPEGFDCSGYVYYVYAQNNINIPRSTPEQYRGGRKIHFNAVQPGDLLFFSINRNAISHVGMYVGNNTFIHAPSNGKFIRYDSVNNPYWQKRFIGAVTYFAYGRLNNTEEKNYGYREERFSW